MKKFHRGLPVQLYLLTQLYRAWNLVNKYLVQSDGMLYPADIQDFLNRKKGISSDDRRTYCVDKQIVRDEGAPRFRLSKRHRALLLPTDENELLPEEFITLALSSRRKQTTVFDDCVATLIVDLAKDGSYNSDWRDLHVKGVLYRALVICDPQASTDAIILLDCDDDKVAIKIVGTKKRHCDIRRAKKRRGRQTQKLKRGFEIKFDTDFSGPDHSMER